MNTREQHHFTGQSDERGFALIVTMLVALVVGANDVTTPAARDDPSSPIAGMPIVEVDRAKNCIVLK